MNQLTCLAAHCALLAVTGVQSQQEQAWKDLPTTKTPPTINQAIEVHEGLTFANYADRALQLDLYRPKDHSGRLPAVVCIHGGGWAKGSRIHHTHIAKALAARGYVTVSIDYRLSGEARFPAQIHDCKAAVRWLRAHAQQYGVDTNRIAATGASAGGHLAALLATSAGVAALEGEGGQAEFSSTIQAAIPMGGQSDLLSERIRRISAEKEIYQQFLGGSFAESPKTYRLASPREHLDAGDPPLFFLTGELDDASTRGADIRHDCGQLGIVSRVSVIPGAPHPFLTRQPFFDLAVDQIDAFLKESLPQR